MSLPPLQLKDLGTRSLRNALDRMGKIVGQEETSWGYIDENGNDAKITATREQILEDFVIRGEKP